ncbi:hypothetical protein AAG906_015231 [Vitis piasezkii]
MVPVCDDVHLIGAIAIPKKEDPTFKYFNSLKRQWQQLDLFKVHEWKCPKDERVFKFLMVLNKDLDELVFPMTKRAANILLLPTTTLL